MFVDHVGVSDRGRVTFQWTHRIWFLHVVLMILGIAWFALVLAMWAYGRSRLSKETFEHPAQGSIYGIITALCAFLFCMQFFSFLTRFLPRWFEYLRDSICDPSTIRWCLLHYKLAAVQLGLQAACAFMFLTSFLFNALGLSLAVCLAEGNCTTGLDEHADTFPLTWNRTVVSKALRQHPYKTVSSKFEMAGTGNIKFPPVVRSFAVGAGDPSFLRVAVDLAVPLTLRFRHEDLLQLEFIVWCFVFSLGFMILYLVLFRTWGSETGCLNPVIQFLRSRLGLQGLEVMSGIGLFGVTSFATYLLVHYHNAVFGWPVFFGVASIFLHFRLYRARLRMQTTNRFTSWEKRQTTQRIVTQILTITYSAGLSLCFKICDVANVWPERLGEPLTLTLFMLATLLHIALTIGYSYSIHAHMMLAKYREADHMSGLSAALPQASATQGYAPGDDGAECSICMDAERNALCRPCNHLVMCYECAEGLMRARGAVCPICRSRIDDVLRVYNN